MSAFDPLQTFASANVLDNWRRRKLITALAELAQRLAQQRYAHPTFALTMIPGPLSCRIDCEVVMAQQSDDGCRTEMPAGPAQGRIAIGILGIASGSCGDQCGNCSFARESSGSVKCRFPFASSIPHEAASLRTWHGRDIRISRSRKQNRHNPILY